MSSVSTEPMPTEPVSNSSPEPSVEVFAVYGVEPEIQAYAMAKYSRSALSMKESLKEITQHKAEKFLNTFYFQYGHRSIADLAHIALAIERLSILATIVVVDEQRWDGQERSTRYQDFKRSGYTTPQFGEDSASRALYRHSVDRLFADYEQLSETMFQYLAGITPKPAEMKQDAYERTLRARAFDISRYLLPLATNTSLGEIVNARTLETQVAHLLSQPHKEVRDLGALLKKAALSPAYNANEESLRALVAEIRAVSPSLADRAEQELLREVRVAPTLVKYADPNPYEIETRRELQQAAAELMQGAAIEPAPLVDLLDADPLEIELADDPALWPVSLLVSADSCGSRSRGRGASPRDHRSRPAPPRQARRTAAAVFFRPSVPVSTFSWTSAASATCTATAAASRSCRTSPPPTATTRRPKSRRQESGRRMNPP